jgi:hypothetical protein
VDGGLLGVMQPEPPPAVPWLAVWDPSTGTTKRIEDGNSVIAAARTTLVTLGANAFPNRGLPLRLVDLTTGAARTVAPPRGTFFNGPGIMSPDGTVLLALVATGGGGGWVAVDVASARATLLAGPPTTKGFPGMGWSPDGQWFFFTQAGPHQRQRVLAYRKGAKALAEVKGTVGPFDAAVAVPAG